MNFSSVRVARAALIPAIFSIALLAAFFVSASVASAFTDLCLDTPDAACVGAAQGALSGASPITVTEGVDTNAITKAQSIVDSASTGVVVTLISSSNSQIHNTTGAITYGISEVVGDVAFHLAKVAASADQTVSMVVPQAAPNWAAIFGEIKTTLAGEEFGIDTNIDKCAVLPQEPTACSGLYFEKTGEGRVTFTASLNLTDEDTAAFLQTLGDKMEASAGSMSFDARTASLLQSAGAEIQMFGLDELGFTSTPGIIVKDDTGEVIDPSSPDYPIISISDYSGGTLTFTTEHFTQFETDFPVTNVETEEKFATIQAAIDDAETIDGNTIQVAAGTYDEQVVIDGKDLTLQGAGDTTIIRPSAPATLTSTYTYPDGTFWVGTVMSSVILVKNADAVTVKNLKIDGINLTTLPAGASRLAGVLYGESGGVIDNVTVTTMVVNGYSTRSYGIDLSAVGTARTVEVMNSHISDWSRNGIQAQGGSLTADIHDNTLTGVGDVQVEGVVPNGILFIHGVDGNATTNTISALHTSTSDGSLSAGILFYDPLTAGIVAEDNNISDVDDGVIVSANANDVIIRNNNLHDNLETGIHLEGGATNNTITGNTITGNAKAGIRFAGANDPDDADSPPGTGNVANNNTITGNAIGVVNYDPDSQTFDATNNWWGDATGPNNEDTNPSASGDSLSGNVNYSPWLDGLSGAERNHNVEVDGDSYNSIQEAINAASSGDTISVAKGTYIEEVVIDRNLTLVGTDGAETTTIDGDGGNVFTIGSAVADLEISGFTITGGGRGITTSGSLNEATINIHDVVVTGNDGAGLYFSGGDEQLTDTELTIADSEVTNNGGAGIYIDRIDGTEEGGSTLTITGNTITNNGTDSTGIDIDTVGNAEVNINENSIVENVGNGLFVDVVEEGGDVDATNNWWGDETGPLNVDTNAGGLGDEVSSNAGFTPWYLNAGRTVLSSVATSEDDTLTSTGDDDLSMSSDTEGEADLPDGITDVVLSDESNLDLSDGLNEDDEVTLQSGVEGEDVVLTNADLDTVTVNIPDGTLIQGPDGWDGIIEPPTEGTPSGGNAPAGFSVGSVVISVGSPDGTLVFDEAVTILLEGVTGTVGYRPAGSDTWQTISACSGGTYDAPTLPTAPGECSINNGTDTKIVTYHFTSFGGMNPNPAPAAVASSGGNGAPVGSLGGGGGGTGGSFIPGLAVAGPTSGTGTGTGVGTGSGSGGEVLGAAAYNFGRNLAVGSRGADVDALQQILIDGGFLKIASPTGYFGALTRAAVIAFQAKYGIAQVGLVGPQTRTQLNKGSTVSTGSHSNLTAPQKQSILDLIRSFGADAATINRVEASL